MTIQEWLKKHNITSNESIFYYTAWYNQQASARHKLRLDIIKPQHIKIFKNTLLKEINHRLEHKDLDLLRQINSRFNTIVNNSEEKLNELPDHLRNKDALLVCLNINGYEDLDIDYNKCSLNLKQLDGLTFDDYEIYLPKKMKEVLLGGLIMRNCMGSGSGVNYVKSFVTSTNNHERDCRYIDGHILKNKKLVGIFALESIYYAKKHGKPVYNTNFFVNDCNSKNSGMEKLLSQLVTDVFSINIDPTYTNDWEKNTPVLPRDYNVSSRYNELDRIVEQTIELINSKHK